MTTVNSNSVPFVLSLANIRTLDDASLAAFDTDALFDIPAKEMSKDDRKAIIRLVLEANARLAAAPSAKVIRSILDLPACDLSVDDEGRIVLKNASTRAPHRFSVLQLAKLHRDLTTAMARVPGLWVKARVEREDEVERVRALLASQGFIVEGSPVVGPFPTKAKAEETTTTPATDAAPSTDAVAQA
jgi:hypothetical protein